MKQLPSPLARQPNVSGDAYGDEGKAVGFPKLTALLCEKVIYPTLLIHSVIQLLHCNVECRRAPPNKGVGFIITGRKHANKIRASVTERPFALPPKW